MATLSVINSFSLSSLGITTQGWQGLTTALITEALEVTVTGTIHYLIGSLATAAVVTVYDDDDDVPADWDYAWIKCSTIGYIQIIAGSTNVIHRVAANQPFVLPGYDSILPAANSTPITGGTEPTLTDVDSVVLGNYSGGAMDFVCAFID